MNSLNQQRSKSLEFKTDYQNQTNDLNEYIEKLNIKKSQANVSLSENINVSKYFYLALFQQIVSNHL